MSIYRSKEGKARILKLYDDQWSALNLELEHRTVDTRYGKTHIVVTGPKYGQPIVVFHGGNMISPVSFAWIVSLTKNYRIYAPDTVGHPGYSAETRLNPKSFQFLCPMCPNAQTILYTLSFGSIHMAGKPTSMSSAPTRKAVFNPNRSAIIPAPRVASEVIEKLSAI
jgi:hypothetical protein